MPRFMTDLFDFIHAQQQISPHQQWKVELDAIEVPQAGEKGASEGGMEWEGNGQQGKEGERAEQECVV